MKTPSERLREHLRAFSDERLAEIDRQAREPGPAPPQPAAREDSDPFGRGWEWLYGRGDAAPARPESPDARGAEPGPEVLPFAASTPTATRRRWMAWASGIAASAAAIGTWLASRHGPLRERDVAAWVVRKMEAGADGGVRIAAPADDGAEAEEPVIRGIDRPGDAVPPSAPNVYAPLRVQDQLVVPELAPGTVPLATSGRPLRSLVENVRPGSLFYLEFSTAATESPGTAAVVRTGPGPWRLMQDEVDINPAEGTSYFGPLKMGDGPSDYLLVLADRSGTPLIATLAGLMPTGPGDAADVEAWKSRLARALGRAGHSWYAVRRIEARP
jgi:hypothetical protein